MPDVLIANYPQQLTDRFRRRILTGELEPGQRLMEVEAAKEFGVSRGPVRDTFAQLTAEGLLEARPNAGVKVASAPGEFKRRTLVGLRRHLETEALRKGMKDRGNELPEALEKNLAQYEGACRGADFESVVCIDMAFHRIIVQSADEGSLLSVWLPVISQIYLRYSRFKSYMPGYDEHARIFAAIRERKIREACRLLREHIV